MVDIIEINGELSPIISQTPHPVAIPFMPENGYTFHPQGSIKWFNERTTVDNTCSELPTICKQNKNESWKSLCQKKYLPNLSKNRPTIHTNHGHDTEREAIQIYEEIVNDKCLVVGFMKSEERENLGGSPDGISLYRGALVEVKVFDYIY